MASVSEPRATTPPPVDAGTIAASRQQPPLPQQIFQNEAAARYEAAVGADIGFVERLVWFWSNHFCISADKDIAMVGAYEREAIRAHVLGRFADMLIAVESHPAMLYYLDNVRSMGANSVAGINARQGAQRKSRPRDSRAAHARCPQRLFANRRDELRQCAHRLDVDRRGRPRAWRRVPRSTSACTSRANRQCSASSTPKRRRSGPRRARRPGTSYGDGATRRTKARPPLCRRRTAAAAGRQAGEGLHGQRRQPQGRRQGVGDRRRSLDAGAHQTQAAVRMDRQHVAVDERVVEHGAALEHRPRASAYRRRSANCCGGRRRRTAGPIPKQPGSTVSRTGSTLPTSLPDTCPPPTPRRCSRAGSARSPRTIPVRPSRVPRAVLRLWRCLSWRRNFCGDDHALCSRADPPGDAARIRDAVRLGPSAKTRVRRRPRPALPDHHSARRAGRTCDRRAGR